MSCEVCGRPIRGKPRRIVVEGAKMLTCPSCSELASSTWRPEEQNKTAVRSSISTSRRSRRSLPRRQRIQRNVDSNLDLVEGFPTIIRKARERLGLDHATLGRKIGEKVSALQKVEAGKLYPDITFARKLEHELKVKVLTPPQDIKYSDASALQPHELTFGDVVSIRKKEQGSEQ